MPSEASQEERVETRRRAPTLSLDNMVKIQSRLQHRNMAIVIQSSKKTPGLGPTPRSAAKFIERRKFNVVREIRHNADYPDAYQEFLGVSADTKPTDCGVNSLFYELDTKDVYYFDGTDWVKVGDGNSGGSDHDID